MTENKKLSFSNYLIIKHNPESSLDSDQDGLVDFEELQWGTDPFVADTDGELKHRRVERDSLRGVRIEMGYIGTEFASG